ncbi:MAG: hypothetical protein AVDCRST_MAG25-1093, partial [uncultured Rubrobacteraceae bacterium]
GEDREPRDRGGGAGFRLAWHPGRLRGPARGLLGRLVARRDRSGDLLGAAAPAHILGDGGLFRLDRLRAPPGPAPGGLAAGDGEGRGGVRRRDPGLHHPGLRRAPGRPVAREVRPRRHRVEPAAPHGRGGGAGRDLRPRLGPRDRPAPRRWPLILRMGRRQRPPALRSRALPLAVHPRSPGLPPGAARRPVLPSPRRATGRDPPRRRGALRRKIRRRDRGRPGLHGLPSAGALDLHGHGGLRESRSARLRAPGRPDRRPRAPRQEAWARSPRGRGPLRPGPHPRRVGLPVVPARRKLGAAASRGLPRRHLRRRDRRSARRGQVAGSHAPRKGL